MVHPPSLPNGARQPDKNDSTHTVTIFVSTHSNSDMQIFLLQAWPINKLLPVGQEKGTNQSISVLSPKMTGPATSINSPMVPLQHTIPTVGLDWDSSHSSLCSVVYSQLPITARVIGPNPVVSNTLMIVEDLWPTFSLHSLSNLSQSRIFSLLLWCGL